MKNVKKIASLLLALLMVFSLAAAASAATVTNQTSHSYAAYRIFSGTQAENSVPLGDVEWGAGVDGAALLTALKGDSRFNVGTDDANIFASCTTALDVAEVLSAYPDKSAVAKAFACAGEDDVICSVGSLYMTAEIRTAVLQRNG